MSEIKPSDQGILALMNGYHSKTPITFIQKVMCDKVECAIPITTCENECVSKCELYYALKRVLGRLSGNNKK